MCLVLLASQSPRPVSKRIGAISIASVLEHRLLYREVPWMESQGVIATLRGFSCFKFHGCVHECCAIRALGRPKAPGLCTDTVQLWRAGCHQQLQAAQLLARLWADTQYRWWADTEPDCQNPRAVKFATSLSATCRYKAK